jgi:hypothetical protein
MCCNLDVQVLDGIFGGRDEYRLLAKSLVISLPATATQTWHEVSERAYGDTSLGARGDETKEDPERDGVMVC